MGPDGQPGARVAGASRLRLLIGFPRAPRSRHAPSRSDKLKRAKKRAGVARAGGRKGGDNNPPSPCRPEGGKIPHWATERRVYIYIGAPRQACGQPAVGEGALLSSLLSSSLGSFPRQRASASAQVSRSTRRLWAEMLKLSWKRRLSRRGRQRRTALCLCAEASCEKQPKCRGEGL